MRPPSSVILLFFRRFLNYWQAFTRRRRAVRLSLVAVPPFKQCFLLSRRYLRRLRIYKTVSCLRRGIETSRDFTAVSLNDLVLRGSSSFSSSSSSSSSSSASSFSASFGTTILRRGRKSRLRKMDEEKRETGKGGNSKKGEEVSEDVQRHMRLLFISTLVANKRTCMKILRAWWQRGVGRMEVGKQMLMHLCRK